MLSSDSYHTTSSLETNFFINIIEYLDIITDDVMNIILLSMWQIYKKLNHKKDREMVKGISLHIVKMHPNFHPSKGILVCNYKIVMITLQKEQENSLKISFCFQNGDKIVIYVSTHGHWDCTTLQHSLWLHLRLYRSASG